jgi:hypothetical protein
MGAVALEDAPAALILPLSTIAAAVSGADALECSPQLLSLRKASDPVS